MSAVTAAPWPAQRAEGSHLAMSLWLTMWVMRIWRSYSAMRCTTVRVRLPPAIALHATKRLGCKPWRHHD